MKKSDTLKKLNAIKAQLINGILLVGTILGSILVALSVFPVNETSFNFDFYTDVICIVILFLLTLRRNRLSIELKAVGVIAVLLVFVITDVLQYGYDATEINLVVIIPFLSILIFSKRTTLLIFLFVMGVYLTFGYLITTGIITPIVYSSELDLRFLSWVEMAFLITIASFAITLFVQRYNENIYKLFKDLETQNRKLTEREALLAKITGNIPRAFVTVVNPDYTIQYTGGRAFKEISIEPSSIIGKNILDLLKDQDESVVTGIKEMYKNTFEGKAQVAEFYIAGQYQVHKTIPLTDLNGKVTSALSLVEDISERVKKDKVIRDNLDEKNVMLQEIHHRVKNNLAVVSGLLSLQSYHIQDEKLSAILQKSTNRILSIAKVHEMLYESENFNRIHFSTYITELSDTILSSLNIDRDQIELKHDIEVEHININHGVPLGIIFNELITNSVKYAFKDATQKKIHITVSRLENQIQVEYQDSGAGIKDFKTASTKNLGFTLIEALMSQIKADFDYETNGKFQLTFSFPAVLDAGPYVMN